MPNYRYVTKDASYRTVRINIARIAIVLTIDLQNDKKKHVGHKVFW